MNTIGIFKLSHSDIELLVCYWCIIDLLNSLGIKILGNENNWLLVEIIQLVI